MKMRFIIFLAAAISATILIFSSTALSQEEIEYKKFKLEESSCHVGVRYKDTPTGMTVGVSAIATGKGVEFRKWSVSGIKLNIGGKRFRPDREGKFYVTEESFWRVPGAIVFAAIGAFGEYGGSDPNNTLGKIGVGLGMGLIALQAKGEITGERCIFNIPADLADKLQEGKDAIEIYIENEDQHLEDTIKVGLIKPSGDMAQIYNYTNTSQGELLKKVDMLREEIISLEKEQAGYKYGEDPQYDVIQRKIELLETERGMAYKTWLERNQK